LKKLLAKKNCEFTKGDNAQYVLKVENIYLRESLSTDSYLDTCGNSSPQYYQSQNVLLSSILCQVQVSLYRAGSSVLLASFNEYRIGQETLKSNKGCGYANIKKLYPSSLIYTVSKKLRGEITCKIYNDMGF
jgi:hypothetical protein